MGKQIYFDEKLVKQLREEVVLEEKKKSAFDKKKEDPKVVKIATGKKEKVKTKESINESLWFKTQKLNRLIKRLETVRRLYTKYKENEKYEREGVSLEHDIEQLKKEIAELKKPAPKAEVKEAAPTETAPTTKPDIAPAPSKPAPKPKTPITPQPNISPKPKANKDVELFVKAREAKRG